MSSVISISRPAVDMDTLAVYMNALLASDDSQSATGSAAAPPVSGATTTTSATDPAADRDQRVHTALLTLVQSRTPSLVKKLTAAAKIGMGAPTWARVSMQDLVDAKITIRDIKAADIDPLDVAAARIARTLADWYALGVRTVAELFSLVGKPEQMRKAMKRRDWEDLVSALKQSGPRTTAWWTPDIWLGMAAVLSARDLAALSVDLDAWFKQTPALMSRAKQIAGTWLKNSPKATWIKKKVLSESMYNKFVEPPDYFA